jgi:glutathione synthase/RimK-type ligase-like ATP-grasp enzyme
MVLIISSIYDTSSDLVIDWLIHYKIPFLRINEDFIYKIDYTSVGDKAELFLDGISINEFKVVWFRKHGFYVDYFDLKYVTQKFSFELTNFILNETGALRKMLFDFLYSNNKIKWVTKPILIPINKIHAINTAKEFGLNVPDTFVISNRNLIEKHLDFNKNEYIIKPVSDVIPIPLNENENLLMLTSTITKDELKKLPVETIPSIIQIKINKSFEVRVFFIDNKFYSSKIVESENKIDHRFNLFDSKTRFESFELSHEIKESLKGLMNHFQINCASIDFIMSDKNIFYFLEINPTGQFGYHSRPNNFYLDKVIADYIKKLYYE